MLTVWVPWVLAAGNATSALLTGRKYIQGWYVLGVTQIAFVAYAIATEQHGFILQNIIMTMIAVYNTLHWRRDARQGFGSKTLS